jgi:ribosomal protein S30
MHSFIQVPEAGKPEKVSSATQVRRRKAGEIRHELTPDCPAKLHRKERWPRNNRWIRHETRVDPL